MWLLVTKYDVLNNTVMIDILMTLGLGQSLAPGAWFEQYLKMVIDCGVLMWLWKKYQLSVQLEISWVYP